MTSHHPPRFHFSSDGVRSSEAIFGIDWAEFVDIVMVHRAQRRMSSSLPPSSPLQVCKTFQRLIKSPFRVDLFFFFFFFDVTAVRLPPLRKFILFYFSLFHNLWCSAIGALFSVPLKLCKRTGLLTFLTDWKIITFIAFNQIDW